MTTMEMTIIAILVAILLIMLCYYYKTKRKISKFLLSVISGGLLLYLAPYIVSYFGGVLTVNLFSGTVATLLGIPGVILLCISALV